MRTAIIAATAALLALGACGDDDEPAADPTTTTTSSTTSTSTTTTEPPSDEGRYEDALRIALNVSDGDYTALVNLGTQMCSSMTNLETGPASDDASNDSPESDAAIGDLTKTMALVSAFEAFDDPEVGAVFLRTTTDVYCPEHEDAAESLLEARGL